MPKLEYYDDVNWNTIATEELVNNSFNFAATQYYTNNLTTQALTANNWVKLNGNMTTAFAIGFPPDLSPSIGIPNRITKPIGSTGGWYKADATAVVRSSNAIGNPRLSLQIVKNGILSSVLPRSCPTVVDIANVDLGLSIDISYALLTTNDFLEVYILSTNATTLTLVDLTFNVSLLRR